MTATRDRDFTTEDITRDHGTRCALCHLSIDMMLNYPHRGMFTIDHIIPLADGGPDTLDNVQPAHYACNSRRGRKRTVTAEQMRQPPTTTRKPKKTIRTRPKPKTCEGCAASFSTIYDRQRFCSRPCRVRSNLTKRHCTDCGTDLAAGKRRCSQCPPAHHKPAAIGDTLPCPRCGIPYTKQRPRQKRCDNCGQQVPKPDNRICRTCGKRFTTGAKQRRYCRNPCTNQATKPAH